MHDDTIPVGLCQCGCGQKTSIARKTNRMLGHVIGQPVRYIQSHGPRRRGRDASRYNGGLSTWRGRTIVVLRDGGNQFYSRCLMEAHLKRNLTPDEIVHHINEDKLDDRIENLEVVTRAEHLALHRGQVLGARTFQTGDDHWSRRTPDRCPRGDRHSNTKLTDAQVVAIRAEHADIGTRAPAFALRYGVHRETIGNILRGKTRTGATANV